MVKRSFFSTLSLCLGFAFTVVSSPSSAEEASTGGARRALDRAEQLQKGLDASDPSGVKESLKEALALIPVLDSMPVLFKTASEKIAAIRAEVEKKADSATKQNAAFYRSDLKIMKEREADFEDLRLKIENVVKSLKLKVEKAKSNPEVQQLLKDEDLIRRSNEALEKLKSLKLPTLEP